jgi:hypothetical protein
MVSLISKNQQVTTKKLMQIKQRLLDLCWSGRLGFMGRLLLLVLPKKMARAHAVKPMRLAVLARRTRL